MNKLKIWGRKLIYKSIGLIKPDGGRAGNTIVLCYHAVGDDNWRYSVSKREFIKQINLLSRFYKFIRAEEFPQPKSILLTFDDGYEDILKVEKFLEVKRIKPLIFVMADRERVNREELANRRRLLSTDQIRRLIKRGWTVGCHSLSHADFSKICGKQAKKEIVGAKHKLEMQLEGYPIKYFAYPKGIYNEQIKGMVKEAGYSWGFSMDDRNIKKVTDRYAVPRIGVDKSHEIGEIRPMVGEWAIWVRRTIKSLWPQMLNDY